MPKGNQKPVPIVARPPQADRDQMATACKAYDKSHTELVCDLWRLYGERLVSVWDQELAAIERIREDA